MFFIGGLSLIQWSLSWIHHFQRRDNDEHLTQTMPVPGSQDHARQSGINRQTRNLPPQPGQALLLIHGTDDDVVFPEDSDDAYDAAEKVTKEAEAVAKAASDAANKLDNEAKRATAQAAARLV